MDQNSSKCTVVELRMLEAGHRLMVVNSYFQYGDEIDPYLSNLEIILMANPTKKVIISTDINARSNRQSD